MSEFQVKVLTRLCEVGLVYRRVKKSSRYYPTTLAALLALPAPSSGGGGGGATAAAGGGNSAKATSEVGHLITETNFKVYAYSPSPVQEALLSKFVDLRAPLGYLLPGLTIGKEVVVAGYSSSSLILLVNTFISLLRELLDTRNSRWLVFRDLNYFANISHR